MTSLDNILFFADFLNRFRAVERKVRVNGQNRWENDAEHSYQLAMLAWYIVSSNNLPLDTNKVIQYALAHDLVETYAGDTPLFSDDKAHAASKHEREQKALERIREEFPDFPDLRSLVAAFEKRIDAESRFVYALDKLQPAIAIYLDNGRTWKERGVTLDMIVEWKKENIAVSPDVEKYFHELVAPLEEKKAELFPVAQKKE